MITGRRTTKRSTASLIGASSVTKAVTEVLLPGSRSGVAGLSDMRATMHRRETVITRTSCAARAALLGPLLLVAASAAGAQASPSKPTAATARDTTKTRGQAADTGSSKPKGAKKPKVDVGGFIQMFYKTRLEKNGDGKLEPDVFRVHRVRIQFTGMVSPRVGYQVEVDPRSPEIAGVLRDAFVSLDVLPHQQLLVGQQKTAFGYENETSSSKLFTVNRTELSESLGRGINLRDIGIGITGFVRLAKGLRLEDHVTLVNGSGLSVQADSTARKNLWGRVGLRYKTGDLTLRLGVSGATGDQQFDDSTAAGGLVFFTSDITRLGMDIQIDHPRVLFVTEYARGNDKAPATHPDASGTTSGYYALLVGKTSRNIGPLVRYDVLEGFQRLTAGGYYGLPASPVSLLFNYEQVTDDTGRHDDKFLLRLQVRF